VQLEVAAERFGPVLEPDQAGAVAEVRAAVAVVGDAHVQDAAKPGRYFVQLLDQSFAPGGADATGQKGRLRNREQ
jgi:hypothetical protein